MKTNKGFIFRFCFHAGVSAALCIALLVSSLPASEQQGAIQDPPARNEGTGSTRQDQLRSRILAIAEAYATYKWRATDENVFHGKDPDGIQVDTPDISFCKDGWHADGRENVGVPYSWGGFCTIEKFDEYVKKGAFAGHAHTSGEARGSRYTVGVDCSGLVSRCLDLPQKQTSLSMAGLCYRLKSYDELLPGDLLNKLDGHVVIFKEFTDESRESIRYYEAGTWRVKETVRKAKDLRRQNFFPMRYKPLDPRWVHIDFSKPDFSIRKEDAPGTWKAAPGKNRDSTAGIPIRLMKAVSGEWARYDVKQTRSPRERTVTRGLSHTDGGKIALQVISNAQGKEMITEKIHESGLTALDMIIGFGAYDQEFEKLELSDLNIENGTYETGGRKFAARGITAKVTGKFTLHGKRYPIEFSIECFQTDDLPMEGILAATYTLEVVWTDGRKMSARRSFTLREFSNPRH